MSLLMGLAYVIVLIYGGRMILGLVPGSPLTLGQFTQFALVLDRLAWPMLSIGMITNMLQRGSASWSRLQDIFNAQPLIKDDGRTDSSIKTLRGEIEFDKVSLNFEGQQVLRGISLRIPAGQTLGITGPTGSGKTVLGNLVTRLIDVSSGSVKVDGTDVRRIPLRVLRENIAVVPQEPFLFSDTIAANVAFGLGNASYRPIPARISVLKSKPPPHEAFKPDMNRVRAASEVAGLAGEIERFPGGYDTMLGERGVTLSGGQRQRTALARAVAREPRILVLDDAMSAVDTETESRILSGLRQVQEGRTVLLIGHRVSTLRHADHIIVMERGQIVEQGSHDELLALGGAYADLERRQRLEGDLGSEDEIKLAEAALQPEQVVVQPGQDKQSESMTQPDEAFLKEFDAGLTRRILRYLRPYMRLAVIGLIATLLFSVAAPLYGLIQRYAIDHALGPKVLSAGSDLETRQALFDVLLTAAGLFLGLRVLDFLMRYAATYTINYLGQKVLYDIRSDIFTKLQRLPLAFFDANPVGRLITRVTSDVDAINQFITAGLVSLITSTFLIIAYVVIMLSVSWPLAIISFLVLPILFYASTFFRTRFATPFATPASSRPSSTPSSTRTSPGC